MTTSGEALFTTAAADKYDRYVGRYSRALASSLTALAGVQRGQRGLDVGCGPGALTGVLVEVLGAGNVAAADPSPSFVEACRERNPGVDVRLAPAEELPFADDGFDHVLSQLVINFMTDAAAGVGEMKRVARDGGRLTSAVWDYRGEMIMLRCFWESVAETDPAGAERDERFRMRWCTPDELHHLWARADLRDVEVSPVIVGADYLDFEDLWGPFESGIGPVGAYMSTVPRDRIPVLKREFLRRLEVDPGKPFQLTARAWAVTGVEPPSTRAS